jgi:hypothetical protein
VKKIKIDEAETTQADDGTLEKINLVLVVSKDKALAHKISQTSFWRRIDAGN